MLHETRYVGSANTVLSFQSSWRPSPPSLVFVMAPQTAPPKDALKHEDPKVALAQPRTPDTGIGRGPDRIFLQHTWDFLCQRSPEFSRMKTVAIHYPETNGTLVSFFDDSMEQLEMEWLDDAFIAELEKLQHASHSPSELLDERGQEICPNAQRD